MEGHIIKDVELSLESEGRISICVKQLKSIGSNTTKLPFPSEGYYENMGKYYHLSFRKK